MKRQTTFATAKLAEAFRTDLLVAAREGVPFDLASGRPSTMPVVEPAPTWLDHAMRYVTVSWPRASARHRRGIAEALTDITIALVPNKVGRPREADLRRVLYRWAFNAAAR